MRGVEKGELGVFRKVTSLNHEWNEWDESDAQQGAHPTNSTYPIRKIRKIRSIRGFLCGSRAALGKQLAALLDPETPVPGVTDLKVRDELKGLGELTVKAAEGQKKADSDLNLTARWGYAGQGGVTMPGPGKVTSGTRGEGYLDIHLNETTHWKDVPEPVWKYTLGGYQVLKKWLIYREAVLLGHPLTSDEAQQFTHHVRRVAVILALSDELDAHYAASV